MTLPLELVVPAPCGWINSNHRAHRMAVAELTSMWRHAGRIAAKGLDPITEPVRIVAWITKERGGRWDPNNLWPTVKALVDGLVDAGLLVDDDHKHVVGPDMRYGGKGHAGVRILIQALSLVDKGLYAGDVSTTDGRTP